MILFNYSEMRELNAYLLRTYLILDGAYKFVWRDVRFRQVLMSGSDVNNCQHLADRVPSKI